MLWQWVVSRGESASTAVMRRSPAGSCFSYDLLAPDGSLKNNHGTYLSNENIDNADNPSKVVMLPVTSHAWRQSVCLTPTHSGVTAAQRLCNIDGKCRTAAPATRNQ